MAILPEIRSEGLFYDIVTTALGRTRVRASEHAEYYLVGLLDSYASAQRRLPSEALALKLLRTDGPERTLELKEVGDSSLVVTGLFPASIQRTPVPPAYFHGLGKAAYRELSSRFSRSVLSEIYDELSVEFGSFVQVLATARDLVDL